ncbi:hypothetical protein AB0J90_12140 [Micromonospora sp. NPDC049523]|uniref:hypothetical protein n=1 Tax=Micromonospora sp. NPDC049523 TaxID=3155921 RepID=UPI003427E50D
MADQPALHGPSRPDWACIACGTPWPCVMRRRQLKELCQCEPDVLRRYLTPYLQVARIELTELTAEQLDDRFLGWFGE